MRRRRRDSPCGDYAPWEIAWSVFDATVEIDGTVYWEAGRFTLLNDQLLKRRLSHYHLDEQAVEMRLDIGI